MWVALPDYLSKAPPTQRSVLHGLLEREFEKAEARSSNDSIIKAVRRHNPATSPVAAVRELDHATRFLQVWSDLGADEISDGDDPFLSSGNQPRAHTSALLQAVFGDSEVTSQLNRLLCRADRKRLSSLGGPLNELGVPCWAQDLVPPEPVVKVMVYDAKPLEVQYNGFISGPWTKVPKTPVAEDDWLELLSECTFRFLASGACQVQAHGSQGPTPIVLPTPARCHVVPPSAVQLW